MKITLPVSDILDGAYANTALSAMAQETPGGIIAFVLSPVHRNALQRMARDAFAAAISFAGGSWQALASEDELHFEAQCDDHLLPSPTSLAEQLRSAVTALLIHMIFASANAPQAAAALSLAKSILASMNRRATTLPYLSPHYARG